MPVTAMPPPVIVSPGGLPASLCGGLPQFIRDQKHYCVLGLRVAGNADALDKASAKLGLEGWSVKVVQISPTQRMMMIKADGRSLAALTRITDRMRSGEFGALKVAAASLPVPDKK